MRNIHVIMTRDDGSEEGHQWEFDGNEELLCDLFYALCQIAIRWPLVIHPDDSPRESKE